MLIGLCGKMGHGKSTIARHLVERHGFERVRFAGVLKEVICARLFAMTEAETDGHLKESPCVDVSHLAAEELAARTVDLLGPLCGVHYGLQPDELRGRWRAVYAPLFAGQARLHSPREIMRLVGGGARSRIASSIWLELWRVALSSSPASRAVVDDVRYPNEIAAIVAEGGEVWRVVRTDLPADSDSHPSETACDHLADDTFAAIIRRATGVPELLAQVDRLIEERLPGASRAG